MHFFDAARRFYGGLAIVAGGLPLAVGLALADKMQQRQRVTACFFGDGAVAEGEFHESLNLASLWKLPVLFVIENNFYAQSTPSHLTLSGGIAARAEAFGIETSERFVPGGALGRSTLEQQLPRSLSLGLELVEGG